MPDFTGKARIEGIVRRALFTDLSIDLPTGVRVLIDPLEWAQRDLLRDLATEPLTTELMGRLLSSAQVYIDVGCHVGYHSLIARLRVGPEGRVVAIDPQPYNCERVLANWRANGFSNLVVYVGAAASTAGAVRLAHQPETDRARLSLRDRAGNEDVPKFRVPVHTLAEVCTAESIKRVHLLKIDVEGLEHEVLKGLGDKLACVDNIIAELLPGNVHRPGSLLSFFQDEGQWLLRTVQGTRWSPGEPLPENNLWIARAIRPVDAR